MLKLHKGKKELQNEFGHLQYNATGTYNLCLPLSLYCTTSPPVPVPAPVPVLVPATCIHCSIRCHQNYDDGVVIGAVAFRGSPRIRVTANAKEVGSRYNQTVIRAAELLSTAMAAVAPLVTGADEPTPLVP